MIYVKINDTNYPATVSGKVSDHEWDDRKSKSITLAGDYTMVDALFQDGTPWSIVNEETVPVVDEEGNPILDENGEPTYTTKQDEFDNSEYIIRGDLTVHMDGTCTVKMGKLSPIEQALSGAFTTETLDSAYAEGVQNA